MAEKKGITSKRKKIRVLKKMNNVFFIIFFRRKYVSSVHFLCRIFINSHWGFIPDQELMSQLEKMDQIEIYAEHPDVRRIFARHLLNASNCFPFPGKAFPCPFRILMGIPHLSFQWSRGSFRGLVHQTANPENPVTRR